MKKERILLCGAFDFINMATGGQPVKSRQLYYVLSNLYGEQCVSYIDTTTWKRNPLKAFFDFLYKAFRSNKIIMLPAHNGVEFFSFFLILVHFITRCSIYYDVIGGWLPEVVMVNKHLKIRLMKFDGIWVETSSMKQNLEAQGFNNIFVLRNFKDLTPRDKSELQNIYHAPYNLCMFSRVMAEKGVEDAIMAIRRVNSAFQKCVYKLDIYGPIDVSFVERFNELLSTNKEIVKYKGVVPPQDSVKVLSPYFSLLFPTHFYTEGIPGTIIDSYCAGVPVISSKWINSGDVIENGKTGILYEFDNFEELVGILSNIVDNPSLITALKDNCLEKSLSFTPSGVIDDLKKYLS